MGSERKIPSSRAEAKAAGEKRYFTGKECPNGHTAPRKTGNSECIECAAIRLADWRRRNSDRVKRSKAAYRQNNREAVTEYNRRYYAKNKQYFVRYFDENRERHYRSTRVTGARRRAIMKNRAPVLCEVGQELSDFCFSEAFELARERRDMTGFEWHVDHLVPLMCETASGLHVWHNIDVVPAAWNLSKGNKTITEPLEWLNGS